MQKRAIIVLPTYNEKDNIKGILTAIFALKHPLYIIGVLVVDDKSPDGTGAIVEGLQKKHKRLFMLQGNKAGLGKAYQRGFTYALKQLKADVVLQMDADFSHPPTKIINLLDAITDGNDVAIGSRYVDGGMIPGNWPMMRIVNSRVANFVARFVGGSRAPTRDLTGGFKAITKQALLKIPYTTARASGYGFMMFLSNQFALLDLKTIEIPISFRDRQFGQSKIRTKDVIEFFKIAYSLNDTSPFKTLVQAFGIGIIALLAEVATFLALTARTDFLPAVNSLASALVGVIVITSYYVLRSRMHRSIIVGHLGGLTALRVAGVAGLLAVGFWLLPFALAVQISALVVMVTQSIFVANIARVSYRESKLDTES